MPHWLQSRPWPSPQCLKLRNLGGWGLVSLVPFVLAASASRCSFFWKNGSVGWNSKWWFPLIKTNLAPDKGFECGLPPSILSTNPAEINRINIRKWTLFPRHRSQRRLAAGIAGFLVPSTTTKQGLHLRIACHLQVLTAQFPRIKGIKIDIFMETSSLSLAEGVKCPLVLLFRRCLPCEKGGQGFGAILTEVMIFSSISFLQRWTLHLTLGHEPIPSIANPQAPWFHLGEIGYLWKQVFFALRTNLQWCPSSVWIASAVGLNQTY